ncbi:MAG: RNA 2',3'-cyclic phosphodiesterase [Chloroflexota bacterium]
MHRLFIAIDLPDDLKNDLGNLCSGIDGAKWVKREQMHLTLRFIGDVDDPGLESIKSALQKIQAASFDMHLEGIGQFPPKGNPRVLWVGLKSPPALNNLQRQINTSITSLGLPPEDHPFSPHITLARFKTPPHAESVRQFFAQHATFKSEPFPVQSFILFSSILAPQGPTYRKEGIYLLSDGKSS